MKKETAQMIFTGGRDAELLVAIADVVGKDIIIHRIGHNSAADVVKLGGDRYILAPRLTADSDNQTQGLWEMAYAIEDNGRVCWVWIGHKLLGLCYQCGSDGKWRNCYSHGDFGKNYASGGTWSGSKGPAGSWEYETLAECVEGRKNEIDRASKNDIFLRYAAIPATPPVLCATKSKRDSKGRYCK